MADTMPPAADRSEQAHDGDFVAVYVTQGVAPSEAIYLVPRDRVDEFLGTRTDKWLRISVFPIQRWV